MFISVQIDKVDNTMNLNEELLASPSITTARPTTNGKMAGRHSQ